MVFGSAVWQWYVVVVFGNGMCTCVHQLCCAQRVCAEIFIAAIQRHHTTTTKIDYFRIVGREITAHTRAVKEGRGWAQKKKDWQSSTKEPDDDDDSVPVL